MKSSGHEHRFIEGVVGNLGLFGGAEPAQVAAVARQSWALEARRGDALARRGEPLPGLFVVGYGITKLAIRGPDHSERVLRLVGAGEAFGAAAALLGRGSPYDALALLEAKVVVIPALPLLALIDREPRFGRAVARMLAESNLDLLAEMESAMLQRGAQRLASFLNALAGSTNGGGVCSVRLPVTKTVVAARLGIKKETLSRLLRRFAAQELIRVTRGEIAILDRVALARLGARD